MRDVKMEGEKQEVSQSVSPIPTLYTHKHTQKSGARAGALELNPSFVPCLTTLSYLESLASSISGRLASYLPVVCAACGSFDEVGSFPQVD